MSVREFASNVGVDDQKVMAEIDRMKFRKSVVRDEMGRIQIVLYDGILEWRSKDDKTKYAPGIPMNAFANIRGVFVEAIRPDDDDEETDRAGTD